MSECTIKHIKDDLTGISWYNVKNFDDICDEDYWLEKGDKSYDGSWGINLNSELVDANGDVRKRNNVILKALYDEIPFVNPTIKKVCQTINAKDFSRWLVTFDNGIVGCADTKTNLIGDFTARWRVVNDVRVEWMHYGSFGDVTLDMDDANFMKECLEKYSEESQMYRKKDGISTLDKLYPFEIEE